MWRAAISRCTCSARNSTAVAAGGSASPDSSPSRPSARPEVAFQYCAADGLVAINTAEDAKVRVRWTISNGRALLTLDEEHAYLLTRDHCIAVADLKTGAVKHTVPAPGFTFAMPSPSDPAMLIASRDGRVFCVRKRGAKIVSPEDIQRALAGAPAAEETPEEAAEAPTAALPPQTSLNDEPIGPPDRGQIEGHEGIRRELDAR